MLPTARHVTGLPLFQVRRPRICQVKSRTQHALLPPSPPWGPQARGRGATLTSRSCPVLGTWHFLLSLHPCHHPLSYFSLPAEEASLSGKNPPQWAPPPCPSTPAGASRSQAWGQAVPSCLPPAYWPSSRAVTQRPSGSFPSKERAWRCGPFACQSENLPPCRKAWCPKVCWGCSGFGGPFSLPSVASALEWRGCGRTALCAGVRRCPPQEASS